MFNDRFIYLLFVLAAISCDYVHNNWIEMIPARNYTSKSTNMAW